jgi:hypothetical protein
MSLAAKLNFARTKDKKDGKLMSQHKKLHLIVKL